MRYRDSHGRWRYLDDEPEGCSGCGLMEGHGPRCAFRPPPRVVEIEGDRGDTLTRRTDWLGRSVWEDEREPLVATERPFVIGDDAGLEARR